MSLKPRLFLWPQLLLASYFLVLFCLRWSLLVASDDVNQTCQSSHVLQLHLQKLHFQFCLMMKPKMFHEHLWIILKALESSRFVAGIMSTSVEVPTMLIGRSFLSALSAIDDRQYPQFHQLQNVCRLLDTGRSKTLSSRPVYGVVHHIKPHHHFVLLLLTPFQ